MREKDPPTTARPVIVLVSVPERRRNIEKDFPTKDEFLRQVQRDESAPKVDYVKTVHKGIVLTFFRVKYTVKYTVYSILNYPRHRRTEFQANIFVIATDDIQTAPIPLDIALIVVAAIVSLGLTSVAVVMVLHMRSKLFETVRLAIYDDEKTKRPERENANGERTSTVMNSSLPREYLRIMLARDVAFSLLDC